MLMHIELCKFQGKGREVPMLGIRYEKMNMIDNFLQTYSVYFDIFGEQKISGSSFQYFKTA